MTTEIDVALDLVKEFEKRGSAGVFKFGRAEVARSLRDRILAPDKINQQDSSLCGPAAFFYSLAKNKPVRYAQAVIDLHQRGSTRIGDLSIKPSTDCKNHLAPMSAADWIALASLRDSQNWFFDYQDTKNKAGGITTPTELANWFKQAGYREVVNRAEAYHGSGGRSRTNSQDPSNALAAHDYFKKGWKVCLLINPYMMYERTQAKSSYLAGHWVVLASPMHLTRNSVWFHVYTSGKKMRRIPKEGKTLNSADFLTNYYGFVGCRF